MTAQHGLEQGLREFLHEQEAKPAYLAEVFESTSRTRQRGPSAAGRLIDGLTGGLPITNRRAMRIAVIGLLLAALVGVALVMGAIRLLENDDPDAFVLAAYQQVATELPPMRLVIRESMEGVLDLVLFYDGDRKVRQEYGDHTRIIGNDFMAERQPDLDGQVWVVSERAPGLVVESVEQIVQAIGFGPTNCAAGWESLGTETLIGRTTRHVRCVTDSTAGAPIENHLWIDLQTGLPLRMASPQGTILHYVYVAELEIGPQPEALFVLDGETISAFEHECAENGGVCPSRDPSEPVPPSAGPPAGPLVTPPPAPGPEIAPADLDAFVAEVHAAYGAREPVAILASHATKGFMSSLPRWWRHDGHGNYTSGAELDSDPSDGLPRVSWLAAGGHVYEAWERDGKPWREWDNDHIGPFMAPTFDLPVGCGIGWRYLGDDLVLDRPAAHLVCGLQEFWIDREWWLVTRAHDHDPYLGDDPTVGLSEVISVTFGPQPAELFAPPPPDEIWR